MIALFAGASLLLAAPQATSAEGAKGVTVGSTACCHISLGKLTRMKDGSATLEANLLAPGRVVVRDVRVKNARIKRRSVSVAKASAIQLPLIPTAVARVRLENRKKIEVEVTVRFTLLDRTAERATKRLVLRLQN